MRKGKKILWLLIIATIVIIIISAVILYPTNKKPAIISMKTFTENYSCANRNFGYYDVGDSFIVEDQIAFIRTEFEYYGNYDYEESNFNGVLYEHVLFIWFEAGNGYGGFVFGAPSESIATNFRISYPEGATIEIVVIVVEGQWDDGGTGEWYTGHINGHVELQMLNCYGPPPPT